MTAPIRAVVLGRPLHQLYFRMSVMLSGIKALHSSRCTCPAGRSGRVGLGPAVPLVEFGLGDEPALPPRTERCQPAERVLPYPVQRQHAVAELVGPDPS